MNDESRRRGRDRSASSGAGSFALAHDRAREIRNFVIVSALFVVGVGAAAHFSSCADRELIHPEQE